MRHGAVATSGGVLAGVLAERGEYGEAEAILRQVIDSLDRLHRLEPHDGRHERFLWKSRSMLGQVLLEATQARLPGQALPLMSNPQSGTVYLGADAEGNPQGVDIHQPRLR